MISVTIFHFGTAARPLRSAREPGGVEINPTGYFDYSNFYVQE